MTAAIRAAFRRWTVSATTMLSGYAPPHVNYQPATAGDKTIHQHAQQLASDRGPASQVTLSPGALAALKSASDK